MLENLGLLKNEMEKNQWTICSFIFHYKKIEYIVLVKRFLNGDVKKCKYALVRLHFMRSDNLSKELECEANSVRLIMDAKTLRNYFGIEYGENLNDILTEFANYLGHFIPKKIPQKTTEIEKTAMVKSLSLSDGEDPRKIYCTHLKRNPEGMARSDYNSDKTKLLRRKLYNYFKDDIRISFCYSMLKEKENEDSEIIRNFSASR